MVSGLSPFTSGICVNERILTHGFLRTSGGVRVRSLHYCVSYSGPIPVDFLEAKTDAKPKIDQPLAAA